MRQLGGVRHAERDRAGGAQPRGGGRRLRRAVVAARATSPAVFGIPASANDSLIVHGTPRSGGSLAGRRDARVGGVGLGERGVEAVGDDRVERRVDAAQQLDVRLHDLARGRLAGADRRGERERGALGSRTIAAAATFCGGLKETAMPRMLRAPERSCAGWLAGQLAVGRSVAGTAPPPGTHDVEAHSRGGPCRRTASCASARSGTAPAVAVGVVAISFPSGSTSRTGPPSPCTARRHEL